MVTNEHRPRRIKEFWLIGGLGATGDAIDRFVFAVVNFGSRSERAEHRPAGSWSAHPHEETVAKS